jgi:hypothetical protein
MINTSRKAIPLLARTELWYYVNSNLPHFLVRPQLVVVHNLLPVDGT